MSVHSKLGTSVPCMYMHVENIFVLFQDMPRQKQQILLCSNLIICNTALSAALTLPPIWSLNVSCLGERTLGLAMWDDIIRTGQVTKLTNDYIPE